MNPFSLSFILIGFLLLGLGMYVFLRQRDFLARAIQTEGEVVEVLGVRTGSQYVVKRTAEGVKLEPKRRYRLVVQFETPGGRVVTFSPSISMRPAPAEVGARLAVVYDPAQPERAQIYQPVFLWFWTGMLVGFGALTVLMGLVSLVVGQAR